VIAIDTSVVVAGFASWHEAHAAAQVALARKPRLPAHVALESFSVLTRLPPPHRFPARLVSDLLAAHFPEAPLTLPGRQQAALIKLATEGGVTGGGIYDALVAATAKHAGATLLTRDRRARAVYELVGASFEFVT
jgi:predicted nucleic acid-binding protein